MELTRRNLLAVGFGAATVAVLPMRVLAAAEEQINAITCGAEVGEGHHPDGPRNRGKREYRSDFGRIRWRC